ncbi:hypothetical protein JCM3774_002505 [Rhodotorula dairenensis]
MDHQRAFTKLTKRIAIEKTILSYRLAARELGVSVHDAKQLLAAYLASVPAKERGVTATYLLTGYLKRDGSASENKPNGGADAMDIDRPDATQSSQNGVDGEEDTRPKAVKTKTMMVVQQDELQAKSALFSPAPSSHVYALAPARLTSLGLLSVSALSLIRPEVREQKWKAAPEGAPAYGGIVHPDGERRVPQGKRKAAPPPLPAAPKAGPSGTSKPVKKEATAAADPKPVKGKGKGKGKEKESASAAAASKGKAKVKKEEPKIRPIGQLGGLFAKKFGDDSKSKKGKKKADSDSDDDASEGSEQEDEDVKPTKKTVPAKRKSTSPAVSRKKPTPAAPPPATKKAAAPSAPATKKKTPEIIMADDDDEFGAWDMDEEALLEAERAAEQAVKAHAQTKATNAPHASSTTVTAAGSAADKTETKAERQKRELEEMMKSDDMDLDEKKPSRAPSLSRASSSSSLAANKPATEKKKGAPAPAQKSLGSFFKKG